MVPLVLLSFMVTGCLSGLVEIDQSTLDILIHNVYYHDELLSVYRIKIKPASKDLIDIHHNYGKYTGLESRNGETILRFEHENNAHPGISMSQFETLIQRGTLKYDNKKLGPFGQVYMLSLSYSFILNLSDDNLQTIRISAHGAEVKGKESNWNHDTTVYFLSPRSQMVCGFKGEKYSEMFDDGKFTDLMSVTEGYKKEKATSEMMKVHKGDLIGKYIGRYGEEFKLLSDNFPTLFSSIPLSVLHYMENQYA